MENTQTGGHGGISHGGIKNADPYLEQDCFAFRTPRFLAIHGSLTQFRQGGTGLHDLIGHNKSLIPLLNLWQNYEITSVTSKIFFHDLEYYNVTTNPTRWTADSIGGTFAAWPWNRRIGGSGDIPTNKPVGFLNKGLRYYRITPASVDFSGMVVGGGLNQAGTTNFEAFPFAAKFQPARGQIDSYEFWQAPFKTTDPLEITTTPAYLQVANEGGSVEAAFSNTVQTQPIAIHGANGLDKTQWYFNVTEFEWDESLSGHETIGLNVTIVDKFTVKFTGPQYNQVTQSSLAIHLEELKQINAWRGEPRECTTDWDPLTNPRPRRFGKHLAIEEQSQMVDDDMVERSDSMSFSESDTDCSMQIGQVQIVGIGSRSHKGQTTIQTSQAPISINGKSNREETTQRPTKRRRMGKRSREEERYVVSECGSDRGLPEKEGNLVARVRRVSEPDGQETQMCP